MNYREVEILKKMINGSNSRQNSRVEAEEHNEGEEEDDEEPFFHRRVIAKLPPRSSSTDEDESLIGMDVLLYAWTGPGTPIAKATISQLFQTLLWAESPLDQRLMRFLSMLQSEGMLPCLINMKAYNLSLMLSQGSLHGHLARLLLGCVGKTKRTKK